MAPRLRTAALHLVGDLAPVPRGVFKAEALVVRQRPDDRIAVVLVRDPVRLPPCDHLRMRARRARPRFNAAKLRDTRTGCAGARGARQRPRARVRGGRG